VSGVLLDTNVISEITRARPNGNVIGFLEVLVDGFVSVLTIHELDFGIRRLPLGKRRNALQQSIAEFLNVFENRVLAIGRPEALRAAELCYNAEKSGVTLHLADALIAATALEHDLILATRNLSDFDALPVATVNPWDG